MRTPFTMGDARMLRPFPALQNALGVLISLAIIEHQAAAQGFTNVAPTHQLNFTSATDNYGGGMSFYDFNGDGMDDLTFAMTNDSLRFYLNTGGNFQYLPSIVYGSGQTRHVLWVDLENDGDMDLAVTTFNGNCRIYRNDGDLIFTDITATSGILTANEKTFGASFGDYDKDGFLDLYVCTYEQSGDESMYTRLNHLYRNNGDGTFTDVTLAAGVGDGIKLSFQGMWMDYNLDGWPDIFVINDRLYSNSMYRNNGDGTFTDVAADIGVQLTGQDPMTISMSDFDNDGDMDIFLTNTGTQLKRAKLLLNNGDGTYTESAQEYGLDTMGWSWGAAWVDITNNSHQDIFIATALPNASSHENILLGNVGTGHMVSASALMPDNNALSFSPVIGDHNGDGYSDVAVHNKAPYAPYLWRNSGGTNHFVKLTLAGTISNRMAIGSWIRVYFNGQMRIKYTVCGENFIGQSSQHYIFGLGTSMLVDSVEVQYLSGHTDKYYSLNVDQAYTFTEGETYLAAIQPLGPLELCPGGSVVLDGGDHSSWNWSNGYDQRYLTVSGPGEFWVEVSNEFGIITISDTVAVTYAPIPELVITAIDPLCHGDATGSILLEGSQGEDLSNTTWTVPGNGPGLSGLQDGIYGYTITVPPGCTIGGEVFLEDPEELIVDWVVDPATSGPNGSISVDITGGVEPYTVYLNGSPAQELNTGLAGGTYDLLVIDANECEFEAEIVVDIISEIVQHSHASVSIYPNPVNEWLTITTILPIERIRLIDARGAVAMELSLPQQAMVDVSELAPGTYIVLCHTTDGTLHHHRIIKMP